MTPSVDYGTLKKLHDSGVQSPFLDARLEYKDVSTLLQQHIAKLFSDYRNNIVADRVHPNMMNPQASGRVGISNPPLGNFTKDETYGPHGLTDVIQPDEVWIVADWSAVELDLVMHRCQDVTHAEVKRRGLDGHTVNAIKMFGYPDPPADPTKDWLSSDAGVAWRQSVGFTGMIRTGVKNAAYTGSYCENPAAVKAYGPKLGMSGDLLVEYLKAYLKSKPKLAAWKTQRWNLAEQRKESRTAFGRRRRLFGDSRSIRKEGLNHEIQGTVADMMKQTMKALYDLGWSMAMQQHDGWKTNVPKEWDDWAVYKGVVERTWIVDDRPIQFGADYEVWYPAEHDTPSLEPIQALRP